MDRRKLLIADDSEMNRAMLANMLDHDFQIIEAVDGHETISALEMYKGEIAALLLDIVMPEMDGFQVLEEMQRRGWTESVPTIMISAEMGSAYIDRAFELGASDYINRPFATGIIRRRIINAILLHTKKQQLMDIVSTYFYRHEKNTEEMVSILSSAVEHRCCGGGRHMAGVSCLTGLLLRRLLAREDVHPLDPADVETVCMAASLHDIGKLMIPCELLEKPDRLTPEEYEIVKRHTVIGAQLIAELPGYQGEKLTKYAMEICRWHHERWNGEGYPDGLKGVNPIRPDDMIGSGEENILNQLLVRNRQVYTDSATQVFNRRYYDERLRSLTGEYALAMIDLDNFKQINDRFGHPAGDAALFHAAQTMRSMLRSGDELVRYGGDEFFLLFHGLPAHVLARKLEDICRAVAALTISEYPDLHLSLSIGGAYGSGRVSELVGKADLALYRAKRTKNCAVVYEE